MNGGINITTENAEEERTADGRRFTQINIGFDYDSCQSVCDGSLDNVLFITASKDNKAKSDLTIR
ncbi:MAG: hypothetical protein JOZ31_02820 [Verrucomicrobia bacterium]|nr:hypothetical protein [Verrucomicrobiota bacterium]MBV8486399.1 hypothetical protein [Verrucomicrobiota bacterium]